MAHVSMVLVVIFVVAIFVQETFYVLVTFVLVVNDVRVTFYGLVTCVLVVVTGVQVTFYALVTYALVVNDVQVTLHGPVDPMVGPYGVVEIDDRVRNVLAVHVVHHPSILGEVEIGGRAKIVVVAL